jgi:phosphate/sulfate permease
MRWIKLKLKQEFCVKSQIVLVVIGIIALGIYLYLKFMLHKKNTYQYAKWEKTIHSDFSHLNGFSLWFWVRFIRLSKISMDNKKLFQILFYVFEPLIFIAGIAGSIIEQRARINEQIYIYNLWYEALEEEEKNAEDDAAAKKSRQKKHQRKKNWMRMILILITPIWFLEKELKNGGNPFMDDEDFGDEK